MSAEMLPEDLLYAENGHASDVVLTCLADGEKAIVPPALVAHVLACPTCHGHLGNAALLSLRAGEEVAHHLAAKKAHEAKLVPSPYLALAAGLLLAILGALPRLATLPEDALSFGKSMVEGGPSFVRTASHGMVELGHASEQGRLVASIAAGALLLAVAAALARRAARTQAS